MKVKSLSRVKLLATPWAAAHQAPPSMGFSRQEYWSGVLLPSPELTTTYQWLSLVISDVTLIILLTSRKFTLFSLIKHFMGRYFEAI